MGHRRQSIDYNNNGYCCLQMKNTRSDLSHKVTVKVAQSCPTLGDPMDYTVRGILRARILQWVAIPFSRGSS